MRIIIIIILVIFSIVCTMAQSPRITQELNLPHAGDVLFRQQIEYKDPGRAGENVIWDFGQMQPVNSEYMLIYMLPRTDLDGHTVFAGQDTFDIKDVAVNKLFMRREHQTMYFEQLKDSALYLLGYQNRQDLMHHIEPLPQVKFPMNYGDSLFLNTKSEDIYAWQVPVSTRGTYTLTADACGMIVLPSGDTLTHVLRTHSVQNIIGDSIRSMDSLYVNTVIEIYKWYARGWRYPVFETVRTVHKTDTVDVFNTAFFFPPPQNDPYMTSDTANIRERERMLAEEIEQTVSMQENPWEGMYYNLFPNPVVTDLQFELYLPRACNQVRVQIRNKSGLLFIDRQMGTSPQGINSFAINMSSLMPDNYVIDFWLDGYLIHGSVVMKQ